MTSGFTFEEFLYIMAGLQDWNDEPNSSGVDFDVRWSDDPPEVGPDTPNVIVARYIDEYANWNGGAALTLQSSGSAVYGTLRFWNNMRLGAPSFLPKNWRSTARHEGGHGIGLENGDVNNTCLEGTTIMFLSGNFETFITNCDNQAIDSQSSFYPPTPTPTPTPEPTPTPCAEQGQGCYWDSDCCAGCACGEVTGTCFPCEVDGNYPQGGCMSEGCSICYNIMEGTYCDPSSNSCWTPLLIDVNGNGFHMTDVDNGIQFDGFGHGTRIRTAWTKEGSDDAWLVLDRNGNGTVDDGTELFSSAAPQPALPPPDLRHGFNALVQYDKPENGGNGDRVLNTHDGIFNSLRLWQDSNHNGVSEPTELNTLPKLGVASIDLNYKLSKRKDKYGNVFRYRAKVKNIHGEQLGRWVFDVYPAARP